MINVRVTGLVTLRDGMGLRGDGEQVVHTWCTQTLPVIQTIARLAAVVAG